ncbi:MAG: SseB family protein [Lachnospiraceae bacterium]|nr:SseB family protein [Lachnospiraceae bacterium]
MADNKLDNAKLEAAVADFAQNRQKEYYAKVMEILEKSMVLMPALPPQGIDEETQKQMKAGKPVQLPKEAKILPCLLRKESGEQILPIFTSTAQIPQDKKSPSLLAIPFQACLSMIMASKGQVEVMVLNPFTHNMVLTKEILEVAKKRMEAARQQKTIRVSEKQFQELVHNRVSLYLLPKYLFEHKEEGLKQLQHEEGGFLMQFYKESYPENGKIPVAVTPEEFSVMTLNVTEDMQITRVDMPDSTMKKGMCFRVYSVWMRKTQEIIYYTMEKTEQGNYIGQVTSDGKHEMVEPAPDNGAEIEAVMNLVTRM